MAGVLAGVIGTAGGITSLVSYPALLAVGLAPFAANATNLVALNACWPGSAIGSRSELAGWGGWLARWLPLTAAGGATGALLLLLTPPGAFARVVPFLIATAALALIAEPWLGGLRQARGGRGQGPGPAGASPAGASPGGASPAGASGRHRPFLAGALALLAVYGGYFGAGSGVMILALLLVMVQRDLPVANAVKNMINGSVTLPAGVLLACFGPVHWVAAAALGAGALAGSVIGPALTRALPRVITRWAVALLGLGLAVWLWVRPSA